MLDVNVMGVLKGIGSEGLYEMQKQFGLTPEDIASAVVFAIDTPDRMSINNPIVRPAGQPI